MKIKSLCYVFLLMMIFSSCSGLDFTDVNDKTGQDILVGIVAGVLTSLIIFFFKNYVIPKIENWRYSDINLTGSWQEKYEPIYNDEKEEKDKQQQDIEFEIKQIGNVIIGSANLRDNVFTIERADTREFKCVYGKIKNGYVYMTFELFDPPNKIGVISYILKVKNQGNLLDGASIYYNPNNERVSPSRSKLKFIPKR